MDDLSKGQKKELRSLNGRAYEIELRAEIKKLEQEFAAYKDGKINVFDLDEKVHEYYYGARRTLFSSYTHNSNHFPMVARALALGLISREEVSQGLLSKIETTVSFFKANLD